jgi:hypothetical protein
LNKVVVCRFPDQPTAAEVVNNLDARDLAMILKGYGEERKARPIAQAIVEAQYAFGNITHTQQLAQIIDTVFEGYRYSCYFLISCILFFLFRLKFNFSVKKEVFIKEERAKRSVKLRTDGEINKVRVYE